MAPGEVYDRSEEIAGSTLGVSQRAEFSADAGEGFLAYVVSRVAIARQQIREASRTLCMSRVELFQAILDGRFHTLRGCKRRDSDTKPSSL
jgi:hypothetical protein